MPVNDRFELRSPSGDNTAEFFFDERDLNISIDNPWAGDTETGFGYTTSIYVPRKHAKALAEWLLAHCSE
jgi:hypothetical protein